MNVKISFFYKAVAVLMELLSSTVIRNSYKLNLKVSSLNRDCRAMTTTCGQLFNVFNRKKWRNCNSC